jgi:hypothetical protein
VELNQIQGVYMPIWKENEQKMIWSGFEELLFGEQWRVDRVSCFHLVVENE